jgi:hypothetical protein
MKKVYFFVPLVTLMLSVGFAFAATPEKIEPSKRSIHKPPPAGPNVVLYDQYDNPGMYSISSQDFEPAYDLYDDQVADDFVVPSGETWTINEVDVQANYGLGPGPADSFNVYFYSDAAGLPGTNVFTGLMQVYSDGGTGTDFVITLSPPAVLTEGTYWLSVQARMDFVSSGVWYWQGRSVQSNNPAVWQNPAGVHGVCQTWGSFVTCLGISDLDAVFRLANTTTCTFSDDFNDGVFTWTELKPIVTESGGVLNITPVPGKKKAAASSDPVFLGCQNCTNSFQGVSFTGETGGKVFLNSQFIDKKNTVQMIIKQPDKAVLKVKIGGVTIAKGKVLMTFDPNTPYDIGVAYDGTNVIASVNGTPVITLTPSQSIPSGIVDVDSKLMSTTVDGFCSN